MSLIEPREKILCHVYYIGFIYIFRYTLDEFGTARRTAIVRAFIDALTRGGNNLVLFRDKSFVNAVVRHQKQAQQTQHIPSMQDQCWANVKDVKPTLMLHWAKESYYLRCPINI